MGLLCHVRHERKVLKLNGLFKKPWLELFQRFDQQHGCLWLMISMQLYAHVHLRPNCLANRADILYNPLNKIRVLDIS